MKEYIITEQQLKELTDWISELKVESVPNGTCLPQAFQNKRLCKDGLDCDVCKRQWLKSFQNKLYKEQVKELKKNGEPNKKPDFEGMIIRNYLKDCWQFCDGEIPTEKCINPDYINVEVFITSKKE